MDATFSRSLSVLSARAKRQTATQPLAGSLAALSELPWLLRFALSDMFAQIQAGELAALAAIRRVVDEETDPGARDFALLQWEEEARHVAFFENACEHLAIRRQPMTALQNLFDTACAAPSLPRLLLANHLVVETLAHELFRDVATIFTWLAKRRWLPSSWCDVFSLLGAALRTILQDESRHLAFGVLRLKALRAELGEPQRTELDADARRWYQRLTQTLPALPVSPLLRPWFAARTRAILTQYRQRCEDVGVCL